KQVHVRASPRRSRGAYILKEDVLMIRNNSFIRSLVVISTATLLLINLPACGGNAGGGNPPPATATTRMQLKLGDAESDRILSFTATLDSLALVSSSGQTTNLLASPVTI